nr:hypothetical protein [Desulfobacterales bacterium]
MKARPGNRACDRTKGKSDFLDEFDARRIPKTYRLPRTGVIGLLIRAKKKVKIESLKRGLANL